MHCMCLCVGVCMCVWRFSGAASHAPLMPLAPLMLMQEFVCLRIRARGPNKAKACNVGDGN